MEVCNTVQETVTKTIPKKNKCSKAKCLSEEDLEIAERRREVKVKGEKERYIHLNAEFQRIARRDKAFLSEHCKETEEKQRMGKARDLIKKIRDTKGTFHAKMGKTKERNGMDLTEAQYIACLENSVVATGLEKVSFHCSPEDRQCQRIFKQPYNFAHFTC